MKTKISNNSQLGYVCRELKKVFMDMNLIAYFKETFGSNFTYDLSSHQYILEDIMGYYEDCRVIPASVFGHKFYILKSLAASKFFFKKEDSLGFIIKNIDKFTLVKGEDNSDQYYIDFYDLKKILKK